MVFAGNTPGEAGSTAATILICLLFHTGTCHRTGRNNLGFKGEGGLPVSLCSEYVCAHPIRGMQHQAQIILLPSTLKERWHFTLCRIKHTVLSGKLIRWVTKSWLPIWK